MNENLVRTQRVTEFPSSGEEGCPTGGVVAANMPQFFKYSNIPTTSPYGYSSSPEEENSDTIVYFHDNIN